MGLMKRFSFPHSLLNRTGGLVLLLAFLTGYATSEFELLPWHRTSEQIESLNRAVELIRNNYFESVSDQTLKESALKGVTEELDRNTNYLTRDQYQSFKESLEGSYGGIGMVVEKDPDHGWLKVVIPFKGSPAARNGIQPNDLITKIKGKSTTEFSLSEAVQEIKGPKGTSVRISARSSPDGEDRTVEIERGSIDVKPVPQFGLIDRGEQTIGYVYVREFSERLPEDFEVILNKLKDQSDGLILDLRNNSGGLLTACMGVAELFFEPGTTVFQIKRREENRKEKTSEKALWPNKPIAVLVNHGTASAAEIISGALRDHKNSPLIGKQTFGKGTVQRTFRLSTDDALKLTVSQYLTPSGTKIYKSSEKEQEQMGEGNGLVPDYEVSLGDSEEERKKGKEAFQDAIYEAYHRGPALQDKSEIHMDQQVQKALNVLTGDNGSK